MSQQKRKYNIKNLRNIKDLPPEERKHFAQIGGQASGASRRAKAELKKAIETYLILEASEKAIKDLNKAYGLDLKLGITNEEAIAVRVVCKAIKGDNKAIEYIMRSSGLFEKKW